MILKEALIYKFFYKVRVFPLKNRYNVDWALSLRGKSWPICFCAADLCAREKQEALFEPLVLYKSSHYGSENLVVIRT